tara:strand:- start:2841 stop:3407 length:567 start_codon:yes stop_codon:yes gene_type:complete
MTMSDERPVDEHIPRDPDRDDSHNSGESEAAGIQLERSAPHAFCGRCGHSRDGLEISTPCLKCGALPNDPKCTFCGYILTGLSVNEKCPECGKPIWDSNINPPTSGLSIASMVLGIVSLISCVMYGLPGIVLGPLAIIFGELSIRQFKRGERAGSTRGFSMTGRICGWISFSVSLTVIGIIVWFMMTS